MLDTVNTTELATDNTNTTAVTSYYGTAGDTAANIKYDPFAPNQVAAQYALEDVQTPPQTTLKRLSSYTGCNNDVDLS